MKNFFVILFLIVPTLVLACPGCVGTSKNAGSDYTMFILAFFILLTYIPLYYIFKTVIKYKDINGRRIP
jgi:hypothetical protein